MDGELSKQVTFTEKVEFASWLDDPFEQGILYTLFRILKKKLYE